MAPSLGRIVHYALTANDALRISHLRSLIPSSTGEPRGNVAHEGDIFPAIIVRVWTGDLINAQVLLDGPDSLWVTSIHEGDTGTAPASDIELGHWAWPARV